MSENCEIKLKLCKKCGKEKPVTEFHKNSAMKDGLQLFCKECLKSINKKYYYDNKDKYKKYYEDAKNDLEKSNKRKEYRKKLVEQGYFIKYYKEHKNGTKQYIPKRKKTV